MRKFMSALCLLAILCVAGLVFTQLYDGENPAMEDIGAGTDELVDQVKDMYEEYGAAAVAQADEKLGDVVEQADEAIGEAVGRKCCRRRKRGIFGKHQRKHKQFFSRFVFLREEILEMGQITADVWMARRFFVYTYYMCE